jgi:hypothetical protein
MLRDFKKTIGGRGRARTGDPLLAKQVLSQLSYTPTAGLPLILKHLHRFQNPFRRIFIQWSEPLFETVLLLAVGLALAQGNCG